MGKMSEVYKALKQVPQEKLDEIRSNAQGQASYKVISMIMQEEGWDYEQAIEACTGENRVPKYSLYYKLSDPGTVLSLQTKKGKQAFAETLPPEEREIFDKEMNKVSVGKEVRKAVKKQVFGR